MELYKRFYSEGPTSVMTAKMLSLLMLVLPCFMASVHTEQRVIGGSNTTIELFPYQVSLSYGYDYSGKGNHICGGAILDATHIITAAHCRAQLLYIEDKLKVRVGSTLREEGGVLHNVSDFVVFDLNPDAGRNLGDVGIVTLSEPITFGSTAQPIALVPEGQTPQHGEMATVSGWGKSGHGLYDNPAVLQTARLPVIKHDLCDSAYRSRLRVTIGKNYICAGGRPNKLVAHGDSGGPLVNDRKQLVGVTSFGLTRAGYPGVFVSVAAPEIRHFIQKHANL